MISGKALSIAHAQIGAQSLPLSNLADYVEHRLVRLAGLCGLKRGTVFRNSPLSNVVASSILPVRKPLPSGLKLLGNC
jgi:hypothetical protein